LLQNSWSASLVNPATLTTADSEFREGVSEWVTTQLTLLFVLNLLLLLSSCVNDMYQSVPLSGRLRHHSVPLSQCLSDQPSRQVGRRHRRRMSHRRSEPRKCQRESEIDTFCAVNIYWLYRWMLTNDVDHHHHSWASPRRAPAVAITAMTSSGHVTPSAM